jgi:hypothetical protein
MAETKADTLKRLRSPGVLIRLDGSAEVFYIQETALDQFKLPESFQARGKGDPELFQQPQGGGETITGDELQRELNKPSLFRKTNLLNAFFCNDGPFIQGKNNDDRVTLVETADGKGHKPLTQFPSV